MEGRAGNSLVEGPGKPSTDEDLGQDNQGTLSLDKMVRQWQWALAPAPIWTGCPLQLMHNYYHHLPRGPLCLSLLFLYCLPFLFWWSISSHAFLGKGTWRVNCLETLHVQGHEQSTWLMALVIGWKRPSLRILELSLHCSLSFNKFLLRT